MGKAVSFSFTPEKSPSCQRCGMKKSGKGMGCCKDEQKIIKTDKTQKVTDLPSFTYHKKALDLATLYHNSHYAVIYRQPLAFSRQPHSPPVIDSQPAYLMNCVFLI
jgi:hypothetical protein